MEGSSIVSIGNEYPTPNNGHSFRMNIFGLLMADADIMDLQRCLWNKDSFLPTEPSRPLVNGPLSDLSDIGMKQAVTLADGSKGLLAKNQLRATVAERLGDPHFAATMSLIAAFKSTSDPAEKTRLGREISNVAYWAQWLTRGVLFEGKLHWQLFCEDVVRAPLSKIAFAANAALGRHQIEFVYDDYTLKAAEFPDTFDFEAVDYENPSAILDAIAQVRTNVGFLTVRGGDPEHNFRFNHSLMEYQMRRAFRGFARVMDGDVSGWDEIVEAAKRANRVFHSMLSGTPPASYPAIRLPIKGTRGACGNVYHPHGVVYEGVGSDEYISPNGDRFTGAFVDNEWGETGANSSMYKWFDILCGVTQQRKAFAADPITLDKMAAVFTGKVDSGELGENPIDSMQRAFDLFTRPPLHMQVLVNDNATFLASGILESTDPQVLLQRLRLAYWVADHRMTHGKYVLKAIYRTEPIGGQSRAEGTGGSTPPFLKLFLDQTIGPGRNLIIKLLLQRNQLSPAALDEITQIAQKFDTFEENMTMVRNKGLELEFDEKVSNNH